MSLSFPGVTIDSAYSRDLDDAVWVNRAGSGWRVTVCVSDVSGTVQPGSAEDDAALAAGFTRYRGTDVTRPMLPPRLSESRLSLLPGRSSAVFALLLEVSGSLEVVGFRAERGRLDHRGRLSYEQAGSLIESGGDGTPGMLQEAWTLSAALLDARRRTDADAWFPQDSGIWIDEEGRMVDLGDSRPVSRACICVQELMILANRAAAARLSREGIRLLYRNHIGGSAPGQPGGRAFLSAEAEGHAGLRLPAYAWFTSPLRRYADLVNQRILAAWAAGEAAPYSAQQLDGISGRLNLAAETEAEAVAESFRRVSSRRARTAIMREDFQSLDPAEFRAVVKAAFDPVPGTGAATGPNAALEAEFLARLEEGCLGGKEIARGLLAHGTGLGAFRKRICDVLAVMPREARAALAYLPVKGMSEPHWDVKAGGPDHERVFRSGVNAVFRGRSVRGEGTGGRREEAKHRAAVVLLAGIAEADWSPPWQSGGSGAIPRNLNAKGELIGLCRRRGLPPPRFEVAREGPPHAPLFTVTAWAGPDTGAETASAQAGTQREAERSAARQLLGKLRPAVAVRAENAAETCGNPKGLLQEKCQARRFPVPVYRTEQSGPPHAPVFCSTVQVAAPGGAMNASGEPAGTKKAAEMLAAASMLQAMAASLPN